MKIRIKNYHCDTCKRVSVYAEQESVVGMGLVYLILGLCTSVFVIGVPFIFVGIIKVMRGYRYVCTCKNCGRVYHANKFTVEDMLRKQGENI